MFGSIRKFAKDRKGAFAMQFALMVVPLCVCTGLAIDGGRAFLARYELASALDAAALAVGSTTTEGADLNSVAQKYVDANFKTEHDEPIELDLDVGEKKAMLRGTVKINTYFMPLVGQPTVTVSAESEVRVGGNNVEVAMALDITGSMNATRIAGLKSAAKILIDEVVNTVQTPYFSKIGIVPWSESVYVDTKHVDSTAPVELRGTPRAATTISNANWRKSGTSVQSIKSAGWRTNSGQTISGITWKNGSAIAITKVTKVTSGASNRIQVTYSAGSGTYYANGDTVYITGITNGSYKTPLNSTLPTTSIKFKVADRTSSSPYTFNLLDYNTGAYVAPPTGTLTNSTNGSVQRCLYAACEVQVTANNHGFSSSSLIYITGTSVSGSGSVYNNTWGTTWGVTQRDANKFTLNGTDGTTFRTWSSGGTASECYTADCKYRIETNANHNFSAGDTVFIWGVTQGSGTTSLLTAANTSTAIADPSNAVFYLTAAGNTYKTWTSGGSVAACANSTCNVDVTSNSHGLATGERIEITGLGGMTFLNSSATRRYWPITKLTDDSIRLNDSTPALDASMSNNYQSNTGSVQCLSYGCAKLNVASGMTTSPYLITPCLVERYGPNAATDVSPSTTPLGMYYTWDGNCRTTNYVTPLTADRARLNTSIDDLKTGGSTAGQIGIAWAWYLLSPNFKDVWDKEATNQPKAYTTKELVKVAVLMTDGEFNFSTCKGVTDGSVVSGVTCSAATGEFTQAEAICQAMKDQKITIYTVGLQINTALYADDFLIKCATKPSYAFLAADEAELQVAFKKIATSISKLRISK